MLRTANDLQKPIVVTLVVSTESTDSLETVLGHLSPHTRGVYVVLQKPSADGGAPLSAKKLKKASKLPVLELDQKTKYKSGHVYLARMHTILSIDDENQSFLLREAQDKTEVLAVADLTFKAIAKPLGARLVGVVLSGGGTDGTQGLTQVHDHGGMAVAISPKAAQFPSMAESAISTGIVDHVLAPEEIAVEITEYEKYLNQISHKSSLSNLREQIASTLIEICDILFRATNHDFKHYKTSTLVRRIQRRMQVLQMESVADYVEKLQTDSDEIESLFKELLINVTSFFRDPEAFEVLDQSVFKSALTKVPKGEKFRIWVAGCSTGEEVYTLAILLKERLEKMPEPTCEVQIIATDIDEHALGIARKGSYPLTIEKSVSSELLSKYFVRRSNRYHVAKELREMCLFSSHNLINDPPFSQLDLISCRNVLIYLGSHLQKKLIPVFHYALKPGGFLFLGTSESLSSHKELFRTVSAKHRLAQRKATAIRPPNSFSTSIQSLPPMSHKNGTSEGGEIDLHMVGQRIVLDEFSPRYAIVNDEGQIMSVSAGINEYLEPAAGTFQNHIIKLVKPSLRIALRSTFNEAKTHKRRTQNDFSVLKRAQDTGRIGITVQPMPKLGEESGLYMVVFRDLGTLTPDSVSVHHSEGGPYSSDLVDQLEKDLASARDDLDKTVQELESSNEELKSSNEELLSMNEELQSANEELEASKEEVQISNEALMRANSDLENLLASTQIATLFLDMNLRIRGFTPAISEIYRIQLSDVGREISDFTTKSIEMPAYPDPKTAFLNVPKVETEVRLPDGRIFTRRVLPYLTPERMQDGIVVTFIDVTDIRSSEERLEMMIKTSPSFMTVMHGPDFVFEKANQQYRQLVGDRDIIGKPIRQAMPEVAEQGFIEILKRVRETRVPYVGTETPIFLQRRPGGPLEKRYVDFAYTAESNDRIFTHGNDVTEKVQARMQIENERENFRNLFRQTPEMVCILSGPDHLFEFVNEAHVKALGFDATGKTVREAQPESVEVHGILDNVYRTGKTAELHEIPITLGDRLRYFNLTYAARRDNEGQINGVMILGTEITHEVVNRTELSRAREEAEKANSTKTRFLANMSHEIRTPLGAIIGFSDLLTQVFPDNETAQNYISRISRNSKQLSRLIDELLDLSKIEANCLHIDRLPMDLNPAIEDVLSAVTLQAHEKGLGFELQKLGELPDQVVTDATRFRQVLINLIGNAVKFTQKGKVTVTLRHFSKDQMDTLEVRVCDTGIGLTQEQVSRLFKPFSQADPSITRQFGGTGLGLALSRELARLLGGDIQLEKTEPNVGSVFCFTIQYPQTRIVAATTRTNPSGLLADDLKKLANRRVLIVDDSADNHVLVSLYLDRAKILHAPAYDGAEAVKMALESEFDLILMDLQMPKMDGLTAVARLRSAGYKQPIIALTAHALRIERERCLANGFNGYVTKPIDQNALLLAMIEALK